jgi:type III secretion protein J
MAGDLQKTLEAVDGILVARVHLNIQGPDPLKDSSPHRSSASVLVEHRGATPPLAADAIQRLVAGGVAGLTPADVAVVMVARPSPAPPGDAQLSHVGPFAVSKSSVKPLAMVLGGLFVLVGALAVAALFLYMRLGRARAEAQTRVSR